jgi:hypothetical protein
MQVIKVFPVKTVSEVKACAYYQNGLSLRKKCCDFCAVWQACDHMDNAEPYTMEGETKVYNPR